MALHFSPISLEKREEYRQRMAMMGERASDYSFSNIWGWSQEYGLEWAWQDDLVWLRQNHPRRVFWAPVGDWSRISWKERLSALFGSGESFIRIPAQLMERWREELPDRITAKPAEDHWDYVYDAAELVTLKGNRYHKKKNLLTQFLRNYPEYEYHGMTPEIVRRALEMQENWCVWRDCEGDGLLESENRAVAKILSYWDSLPDLTGGAILVEGKMAAFTVAERIDAETLVIHFEKGMTEYKGVYQAINQMFLEQNQGIRWVNREQDLGDPGLRKAKKSYHPDHFIEKYDVELIPA